MMRFLAFLLFLLTGNLVWAQPINVSNGGGNCTGCATLSGNQTFTGTNTFSTNPVTMGGLLVNSQAPANALEDTVFITGTEIGTAGTRLDAMRISPTFQPITGQVTLYGSFYSPTLDTNTSVNIGNLEGIMLQWTISANYTGTLPNLQIVEAQNVANHSTVGPMAQVTGFWCDMPNWTDDTLGSSGSIEHACVKNLSGGSYEQAPSGVTINNEVVRAVLPAGSPNGGTNNNYGIWISGNGGAAGTGTVTNYGIFQTGTGQDQFSGAVSVTATALPTQAAGTLGISGEASLPTLAANGEGDLYITSTTGGITLIGKGSVNDFTLINSGGTTACVLPTGTTNLSCPGVTVTGSTSPTNGIYLPAASTTGIIGASALEFLASTNKMDYNVTTASTWTLAAATTINNATFKVTTLAASTAIDTVCYTTATGLFTEEPTGTTCTVSDERKKVGMKAIDRHHSLDIVLLSKPISFYYRADMDDPNYHLGFGAQTLARIAPELVTRDDAGIPNAVKQIELLPITWAAIQQVVSNDNKRDAEMQYMQAEIAALQRRVR